MLQVANIDFSYGPVQVLFDVNFEVRRGEVLALLGTNGAGQVDDPARRQRARGARARRRAAQRAATSPTSRPRARARLGIVQLPGGKGVFPSLTVEPEPRGQRAARRRAHRREIDERVDGVLELFPELARARQAARRQPLGRPAADARARPRADPRARDPADRRAVARARAGRRAAAARGRRRAEGARPDDADRRAVAQRRARRSPTGRSSSRRARCASRARRTSCSSATTSPAPCSSAPRAADARHSRSGAARSCDRDEPARHRVGPRPDRGADRDGHRARLPVEPGDQLRGRRPRRPRGRAARGHGRQAPLAVLARARRAVRGRARWRARSSSSRSSAACSRRRA